MKKDNLIYIYTFIILILPIINVYQPSFAVLPIGDILLSLILFMIVIYVIINNDKIKRYMYWPFFKYLMFVLIQFLIYFIINGSDFYKEAFFNTFHYLFYLVALVFFMNEYFSQSMGYHIFKRISVVSTVFLFFQEFMLRIFGIYVPGHIPGINLTNPEIMKFNETASYITQFTVRPRSIFPEPAHYAQYVLILLSIELSQKKKNIEEYYFPLVLSLGILISRSSTGILLCSFLWGYHFLLINSKMKVGLNKVLFVIFLFPVVFIFLINSTYFHEFLNRFITTSGFGKSTINRFEAYSMIYNSFKYNTSIQILFGHGMVDSTLIRGYMPGFVRQFYYFGFTGTIILLIVLFQILSKINKNNLALWIIMVVMNIGGDSIFGSNLLLFMPFLIKNFICCRGEE